MFLGIIFSMEYNSNDCQIDRYVAAFHISAGVWQFEVWQIQVLSLSAHLTDLLLEALLIISNKKL